jgi:uncharacterized membrane protein
MESIQLAMGRLLLVGVFISLIVVCIGGSIYLLNHGSDIIHYSAFQGEPQAYTSIINIFSHAFSSLGLIQLGLLFLVLLQILRVAMTTWLFVQTRDGFFIFISLFILVILIYSLVLQV